MQFIEVNYKLMIIHQTILLTQYAFMSYNNFSFFCLHEWITNVIVGGGIEQWKVPLIIAHFVGKI